MLETIVNVIWGIICFLGIINFFAGNGGRGTQAVAFPLVLGAVAYYASFKHFLQGLLLSSVIGVVVIIVMFFLLAKRIKKEK